MIGHQPEGMHPLTEALHVFGEKDVERRPVGGIEKHVLPRITAQDDVVQATGDVKSGFAGHAVILLESNHYAIYQA